MCRYKILISLLLLFFSNGFLLAQEKEESYIKASYILNFVEEIIWPNEGEIKIFNIGVLDDPMIYSHLKDLSQDIVIRGKKVKVTQYQVIPAIKQSDLLVISNDYSRKFDRYDFLGASCLMISSNANTEDYKMINFSIKENKKIQFEMNADYLKIKGFTVSVKLLIFGGQSSEVLGAFSESEALLMQKNEELKNRNEEIKEKELKIWKLGQEITQKENDIIDGKSALEVQGKNRSELNTKLEEQKSLVNQYNVNLKKYNSIDIQRQQKLAVILAQLKAQKKDIDENNKILTHQKTKISQQEEQLIQKESELKNSMLIVGFITLVLLLLVISFYLLFRSNRSKKQALNIIEKQNKEIIKGSFHKDEFIANMSHEIRTPLNVIVGFTNLLIGKAKTPQNKSYLNKVLLSSNNLLNIINDILDISKIESGKLELETIDFDLHLVIRNIFYSIDLKTQQKDFAYTLTIDQNIPKYVNGDPTKIGQIILNLLNNAIKFTTEGYVKLDAELISKETNKAVIKIKVSDTGIGIAKDRIDSIFEKFTQEDLSITRKHGGTGLGLSITKSLVKLMQGKLNVKSIVGEGSTFDTVLTLPIVTEPQDTITESDILLIDGIEKMKLIFADDHELNRETIILQFKQWNNKVEIDEAKNGAELVQKVQDNSYDIILTDIRMPIMSGIEATKIIRANDPHAIIIGLSANATVKSITEGKAAGMNDYLTKPIQFNQLLHSIATHINLPYKVIKRDFINEEDGELLARLKGLSENQEDFVNTTKELILGIDEHIEYIKNGDYSYNTIHSLLNKVIYIENENLLDKTKSIQQYVTTDQHAKIDQEIDDLKSDWNDLKIELKTILSKDDEE